MKKNLAVLLIIFLSVLTAYARVSPVVISEVFYDTPLEEDMICSPLNHHNGEFIELYNPGSNAVDVSNWSIRDGKQQFFFPRTTIIYARSTLVIAFKHPATDFELGSLFPEINNYAGTSSILYQSSIWFSNEGEKISLYNSEGRLVDEMSYRSYKASGEKAAYWPISAANGRRMHGLLSIQRDDIHASLGRIYSVPYDYFTGTPTPLKIPEGVSLPYVEPFYTGDIDEALPVGCVEGTVQITPAGGALYEIPVEVPSGANNLQPRLSIRYHSDMRKGLMGLGWDVSGQSVIARTSKNLYEDQIIETIKFDSTDPLTLDGRRLIKLSGQHAAPGAVYALEKEDYSRIEIKQDGASIYFELKQQNGGRLLYGTGPGSKVQDGGKTLYWKLSRMTDAYNNYIDYEYDESNGHALSAIRYGTAGSAPHTAVNFIYSQHDRYAVEAYNLPGFRLACRSRLLTNIQVCAAGSGRGEELIREYKLSYYDDNAGMRLDGIVMTDGQGSRLNATLIEWEEPPAITHPQLKGYGQAMSMDDKKDDRDERGGLYFGDVNGDGYPDRVEVWLGTKRKGKDGYIKVYLADGWGTYQSAPSAKLSFGYEKDADFACVVKDVNKDNKAEIIFLHFDKIAVYEFADNSLKEKYSTKYYASSDEFYGMSYIGDNAEGFPLVVINKADDDSWNSFIDLMSEVYLFNDKKAELLSLVSERSHLGFAAPVVGRFGTDGKTYIVWPNTQNKVYHEADEYAVISTEFSTKSVPKHRYTADFNNDGLDDILYQDSDNHWYLLLNTGGPHSFEKHKTSIHNASNAVSPLERYRLYTLDYDGDGLTDVILADETYKKSGLSKHYEYTTWYFYKNTGGSFMLEKTQQSSFELPSFLNAALADINGDGVPDLVFSKGIDGVAYYAYTKNQAAKGYMVKKITNGFGLSHQFIYGSCNDCKKSSYTDLVHHDNTKRLAVAAHIDEKGSRTEYRYASAKRHKHKGFIGYEHVAASNDYFENKRVYKYETDPVYHIQTLKKHTETVGSVHAPVLVSEYGQSSRIVPAGNDSRRYLLLTTETVETDKQGITVTTRFDYDQYGNPVKEQTTAGEETTTIEYAEYTSNASPFPYLPQQISIVKERTGRPAFKKTCRYAYTKADAPASVLEFPNTENALCTQYAYYPSGAVEKIKTKAHGCPEQTVSYTYDENYRFVKTEKNVLGQCITTDYDSRNGTLKSRTDINGLKTEYVYDGFGQLIQEKHPSGQIVNYSRQWDSRHGALYKILTSCTGLEKKTTVYYDRYGREMRTETTGWNNRTVTTRNEYSRKGELIKKVEPHFSGEEETYTAYEYDICGRLQKESYYDGSRLQAVHYAYDGLETSTTYADGTTMKTVKDLSGAVVERQDAGGTIRYAYNAAGMPVEIAAGGGKTTIEYDEAGRQTALHDPDAGTVRFGYYADGQLRFQVDAKGDSTVNTYDEAGRLAVQTLYDKKTTPPAVTETVYSYNNSGRGIGRLAAIVHKTGGKLVHRQQFTYNAAHLPETVSDLYENTTYTFRYSYDELWRPHTTVSPSGLVVENIYDGASGSLAGIKAGGTLVWEMKEQNARGQAAAFDLGNGTSAVHQYYPGGLLKEQRVIKNSTKSVVQHMNYEYDPHSYNLTLRSDIKNGRREEFTYDKLNRLTQAVLNGKVNSSLQYHDNGNIKTKNDVGTYLYQEDKRPHALAGIKGGTAGPGVTGIEQNMSYTAFNKLASLSSTDGSRYNIAYGLDQQRIKTTYYHNGIRQYDRYYFGSYEKEVTAAGRVTEADYIYTPSGLAAMCLQSRGSRHMYYIHTDNLGSVQAVTGSGGEVVSAYAYTPWGGQITLKNPPAESLGGFCRGYTGHEHLKPLGLINMNGRVYDPVLARFLSPDPYVPAPDFTQAFNRYSYCLNNPFSYVDPDGELPWLIFAGAALISGTTNLISNWGKVDNLGSALSYFANGAVGGAIAVVNPWVGGSVTAGGNIVTDLATGHMPDFSNPIDVLKYAGGVALDGFSAAGIGQMGKQIAISAGYYQATRTTGQFAKLGPSITSEAGVAGVEVTVTGGKIGGKNLASNVVQVEKSLVSNAAKGGLTNSQLVQKSATLAEKALGGQGPVAGIAKHKYATNLLDRYQSIYGHRGLFTNHSFNNGVGNRGILDVLDKANGIIYDFKFGKAVMRPAQYNKYYNNFGLLIQIIKPR